MTREDSPRVWIAAALFLSLIGSAGCEKRSLPTESQSEQLHPRLSTSSQVTTDPEEFADAVKALEYRNEILVVYRSSDAPRHSPSLFEDAPSPLAISSEGPTKSTLGFSPATGKAKDAVLAALREFELAPYLVLSHFPVLGVRVPDDALLPLVKALLKHPNIDYLEANAPLLAVPDAAPLGNNDPDLKHEMHQVLDAWDYSRGSGAVIRIFDSGLAEYEDGSPHEDGEYLGNLEGVIRQGCVNNYAQFGMDYCPADYHNVCNCIARDDHGHGTAMVGVVGENDNDLATTEDFVGVAPFALTVSMKIAHNQCTLGYECLSEANFWAIDEDDWLVAINVAAAGGHDPSVVSMSFSKTGIPGSVADALTDAYNVYDVLLLSSTGNSNDGVRIYPQALDAVIGVGGLDENGNSILNESYEEVSAYSGGGTLLATCPLTVEGEFCLPDGYKLRDPLPPEGGTSISTALTAGVAGLVRAYFPSWDAAQVRDRLLETADGPHNSINAFEAIVGDPPIVKIIGDETPEANTTQEYLAQVYDGKSPFSYAWYHDGQLVDTDDRYTVNVGYDSFELRVDVIDDVGRTTSDTMVVQPGPGDCTDPICPQ